MEEQKVNRYIVSEMVTLCSYVEWFKLNAFVEMWFGPIRGVFFATFLELFFLSVVLKPDFIKFYTHKNSKICTLNAVLSTASANNDNCRLVSTRSLFLLLSVEKWSHDDSIYLWYLNHKTNIELSNRRLNCCWQWYFPLTYANFERRRNNGIIFIIICFCVIWISHSHL